LQKGKNNIIKLDKGRMERGGEKRITSDRQARKYRT